MSCPEPRSFDRPVFFARWPVLPFNHDSHLCRSPWNLVLIADGEVISSVKNESESLKTEPAAVEADRVLITCSWWAGSLFK